MLHNTLVKLSVGEVPMPPKRPTAVLVTFVLGLCAASHASAAPRGDGSLILIGGGLRDASIYHEIIRRAGGKGQARIGVISDASRRYARESAEETIAEFRRHGAADAVRIELDPETGKLRKPAVLDQVTGLFFTGGDQERLRSILRPYGKASPGLRAITRARARGMVLVAGTSAGAAVQVGPHMIMGGESYEALRGAAKDASDLLAVKRASRPGFGFFPYGALDTHCSARGREGRMAALAATTRQSLAFGVGENTALVVERAGDEAVQMRVLGSNGVSIVDLSSAATQQENARQATGQWSMRDVRFSHLTDGDRLVLQKGKKAGGWSVGEFRIARAKQPVKATRRGTPPSTSDIFSSYRNQRRVRRNAGLKGRQRPRELVRLGRVLFGYHERGVVAGAFEDRGRHDRPVLRVGLERDAKARAYGPIGRRSFTNLRVDLSWKRPHRAAH